VTNRLDQILVIDVEATCWAGKPPPDMESEIIEIGMCTLDITTGQRLEKRSILVKPQRSTVSEFCTELTTLTPEQVARGASFTEACLILRKQYASRARVWASYGDYDRRQFEHQCVMHGVPYPFGPAHMNVKTLFALVHNLPHEIGLDKALKLADLPLEGRHHRGDDDAWNIAALMATLLKSARMGSNGHHHE
jgi:inhibitor of KinA sporulation pathway (predicted exonuclease)